MLDSYTLLQFLKRVSKIICNVPHRRAGHYLGEPVTFAKTTSKL